MTNSIADDYIDDDIGYHRSRLTKQLQNVKWDKLPLEAIIDVLSIVSNADRELTNGREN